MLPMPHIDESLKEIAYALDTLHADGIGMLTDYGDKWLGYREFQPVFDELNRRKAVVYTHPTTPTCCVNLAQGLPDVAVEYGADTTRTIVNLIFSRRFAALPGYQLHLLPRRRRADGGGGAVADPDGKTAAVQGEVHPRSWCSMS